MEAFHYRYHPLAARMREVCDSGELGALRSIEVANCFPLPAFGNIRYSYPLAGGALMDAGCYALHCLRFLGGATPEVLDAQAKHHGPDIDRAMTAHLRFPDGVAGRITASMWSSKLLDISARVVGDRGEMRVTNFVMPQLHNSLKVKTAGGTRREHVRGEASYTYQLRAFAQAILSDGPVLTPPSDAVVSMNLIDEVYRAAGMRPRGQ
jgi:predicted dehydrogenase